MAKKIKSDDEMLDDGKPEVPETGESEESRPETEAEGSGENDSETVTAKKNNGTAPTKSNGKSKKNGAKKLKNSDANGDLAPENAKIQKPEESKKRLIIILSAVGVLLAGTAIAGFMLMGKKKSDSSPAANNSNTVSDLPKVPRKIDGVLDTPDNTNRYPVAVMIENHTQARPQSGLDKANIVYEALAEGGITRFMGIFTLTEAVKEIGPIRSARPYYVDWARGYDAIYAHGGGSPVALTEIAKTNLKDLNQFFNGQYFYRNHWRKVATEHTLYSSSDRFQNALKDKKMPEQGTYDAWTYKAAEASSSARPASQDITIDFSSFSYKVGYQYDPVTNTYLRSQADAPHVMHDGTRIAPKNVAIIRMARRLEDPKDAHGRLTMDVMGGGTATYFIDGIQSTGTWKKTSPDSGLQLLTADGTPVQLNAGQSWVEVVPPEQTVTVK